MAIAGRVAIVPKGDWSADATYKRLDAVTYNNTLYFAKKEVPAGTVTSNTEYWSKSIVGGVGAIAKPEEAGIVKPDGKSMSVDENGTLSINLDGTTITLDEAKNVIKLADALKDKIGTALQPESIANNQTTTEAGFALDARQANPSIEGTLGKLVSDLSGKIGTAFYAIKLVTDANDAEPGLSRIDVGTDNHNPFDFWTILLTIPFVELSGGYSIQFGMSIAAKHNGKLAARTKDGNTWGEWSILSDFENVSKVKILQWTPQCPTTDFADKVLLQEALAVQYGLLIICSIRIDLSERTPNEYIPIVNLPKKALYGINQTNMNGKEGAWYIDKTNNCIQLRSIYDAGAYWFNFIYLTDE